MALVSTILPAWNAARYLSEAIDSALQQTLPAGFGMEIVVVDDGSQDETCAIAAQCGVRVVSQPHSGAAVARNFGVSLCNGDLLAFLDSDDLWTPEKTALQCAALAADSTREAVFGQIEQFISPELTPEARARLATPGPALPGYHAGAMLIRREAFERVGGFPTQYAVGEFIDWYARANLRAVMLPQVVMRRRLHQSNQMRLTSRAQITHDFAHILHARLARQRAALP